MLIYQGILEILFHSKFKCSQFLYHMVLSSLTIVDVQILIKKII